MILEVRWSGQQTILPPSLHPAGKHRESHASVDPAAIEFAALRPRHPG
jgi:hypothetical protein